MTWKSPPEWKDLSCKGSLAESEAHYFTGVMYQSSDLDVNRNFKENSPPSKTEGGGSRRRDEPTLIYGYYRELLGYVEQFVNRCSVAVPRSAKMPNGWSGGFAMNGTDLKELLKAASDNAEIGKIVVHALPIRTVNAAEVIPFVEECPQDRVAVEEQDHKFYIIHLSEEPKLIWLVIGPESPIFLDIQQRHAQWMTEHPDWKGWIAF